MNGPDFSQWQPGNFVDKLTSRDKKFIIYVLKDEGLTMEELEGALHDVQEMEIILDNPKMLKEVVNFPDYLPISLPFYFYLLIRKSLKDFDIENYRLTEYLVNILTHGLTSGGAFNNAIHEGKTYFYVSDSLAKIQQAPEYEKFFLRVALANQALYMAGLFKEHLEHRENRRGAPNIEYIEGIGQQQYEQSSMHPMAKELRLYHNLVLLAERFPEVRKALNLLAESKMSLGDPFINEGD